MQDLVTVTGMILKTAPVGEYDRRVTILTRERGKISAFAKGARKPNSRLAAAASPFSFGSFKLYEGRSAYNIAETDISNYFETLRSDFEGACYGVYFLEIADYYTRENNDEKEMLKLLYQSLRALIHERYDNRLVRYIFELKAVAVAGEFPGIPESMARSVGEAARYAVAYIVDASVEKLYRFAVTGQALFELGEIARAVCGRTFDRNFKSLEILEKFCVEKQG